MQNKGTIRYEHLVSVAYATSLAPAVEQARLVR